MEKCRIERRFECDEIRARERERECSLILAEEVSTERDSSSGN